MNSFQVLRLPSWFPGMSLKRDMAIARKYSEEYLERPFDYALQKGVIVILSHTVCTLNNCIY